MEFACCFDVGKLVLEDVEPGLGNVRSANAEHVERLLEIGRVGKQSATLLPLVFAWLESCRQRIDRVDTHELSVWSKSGTHLIEFGKPNLWHAVWYLRKSKKLKQVAFLAHLKKGEPNDILIFERGQNWATERMEERERERMHGKA